MKKLSLIASLFILIVFVLATTSLQVLAAASVEFPSGSTITVESDSKSKTLPIGFQVKNNGDINLTGLTVNLSQTSFKDDDDKQFTVTASLTDTNLNVSGTTTGTVAINVPNNAAFDEHEIVVSVKANEFPQGASFTLRLEVNPNGCKAGIVGDMSIEIKDPDDGDEFEIGETITIRVEVDNDDTDDHDFVVKAMLYDATDHKKLETVESDEVNIDDDNSETIELDLEIPTDKNIDEDNDFVLLVKAFEDGNENEFCDDNTDDILDIKIEVPSHKLVIEDASLTPSQVQCGQTVTASVDVKNVGSSNEKRVRLGVREPTLNINVFSDTFELEEVGEDDEASRTLTFQVPGDAKTGTYTVEAIAESGTAPKASELLNLQVTCEVPVTQVSVTTPSTTLKVSQGSSLNLPLSILNNAKSTKTFTIESRPIGDFADTETQEITLTAGEEGSLTFVLNVKSDASPGSKTVLVTVKEAESLVTSKSVSVLVESKAPPITGGVVVTNNIAKLFGGSKNAAIFFIIADILLVIIALYVLVLIFRKRKQ